MNKPQQFLVILLLLLPSLGKAEVSNIIVFFDGSTAITLIDSVEFDSLKYIDRDSGDTLRIAKKKAYFVYNDFGRMFYYSPSSYLRMNFLEEYGGFVRMVDGNTIFYDQILFDKKMIRPHVALYQEGDDLPFTKVPFQDIHFVRADGSVLRKSVRNGFYTSIGSFTVSMLLQIYSKFNASGQLIKAVVNGVNTIMPGFPPEKTGSQYHSLTFFTPAATMAWMMIDLIFDRRTQYFRPLEREKEYPRSMYKFSIKVIFNRQIEKIQHRLKEKQAEKDEEEKKKKQALY
ncbi:MAG: hypothetical protein VX789_01520 [Candidatus Neomarinimicrobiota bacterium]|nr:hypothetical protein [Candidatus Neomarinimicrobiota bacterium]